MNAAFAVCALVMSGWVSQDLRETAAPSPQNPTQNAQNPPARKPAAQQATRPASNRPSRAEGNGRPSRPRMPLSPTDPRTYADTELPLPPTMDSSGPASNARTVANRPRYVAVAPRDSSDRRSANDKPFDHHRSEPAVSPYMLLYNSTANGTVSTYNAYVRPALAQQAEQNGDETPAGQGTPSYPSVFLNHGPYYQDDSDVQYR
jgi:hypothetical protein